VLAVDLEDCAIPLTRGYATRRGWKIALLVKEIDVVLVRPLDRWGPSVYNRARAKELD